MKKLIVLLILSTNLIIANPLLEAIDQSNVSKVVFLLNETSYSKALLEGLFKEASLVKKVLEDDALIWSDFSKRLGGSSIVLLGVSLLVDGVWCSPYTPEKAREEASSNDICQMNSKPNSLDRGPKKWVKIIGGTLVSALGYYVARKGFKRAGKRCLRKNAQAIEGIIQQKIEEASGEGVELLGTTMSLKETRRLLEQAIVSSDFYSVRKAIHALKFYGITSVNDKVDYSHLAAQVLKERQEEVPLVSSSVDLLKTGVGAGGLGLSLCKVWTGICKFVRTYNFEEKHKVALPEYGRAFRHLSAACIGMSLGKYFLIDGLKRTAQKRRLSMAERIVTYINVRP